MNTRITESLWGKNAKILYLIIAAVVVLFTFLGARDIWTQEHRWADIVTGMFYRHDFLHPYLGENNYYDKPLLSYWLIAAFSYLSGTVSTWALRLPSALAGLIAVFSIYRLGFRLKDKSFGMMAAWLLLTTFYFIFWARTSSADMLNVAGTIMAVAWYFEKKDQPGFFNFAIFFLILAVTALCKGLVGAIVPVLAIFPDLLYRQRWKKYLTIKVFAATMPAMIVYALPFWASSHFGGDGYQQNGLYLVYRENILRYFQPFDHKGPIYTYFIYLPIYLFPWALFFIPALIALKNRWKTLDWHSKWMAWSLLLIFVFFTLSGSRRSYYVLPMVPFAILFTADWIYAGVKRMRWAAGCAIVSLVVLFLGINIAQSLYYAQGGLPQFAKNLKATTTQTYSWQQWQVVMLDAESKTRFYLQLPPVVEHYAVKGSRKEQSTKTLLAAWPILKQPKNKIILLSRAQYAPLLNDILLKQGYQLIETPPTWGERLLHIQNKNAAIAYVHA